MVCYFQYNHESCRTRKQEVLRSQMMRSKNNYKAVSINVKHIHGYTYTHVWQMLILTFKKERERVFTQWHLLLFQGNFA